jgi:hypothetical protein
MQWKTILLEWWCLIYEKRCDSYSHSQEGDYNHTLKEFLQQKQMSNVGVTSHRPRIYFF